jgi:hypothetical protein
MLGHWRQDCCVAPDASAIAFDDGGEIADRDPFFQEILQDALDARPGDLAGRDFVEQLLVLFGDSASSSFSVSA